MNLLKSSPFLGYDSPCICHFTLDTEEMIGKKEIPEVLCLTGFSLGSPPQESEQH